MEINQQYRLRSIAVGSCCRFNFPFGENTIVCVGGYQQQRPVLKPSFNFTVLKLPMLAISQSFPRIYIIQS